MGTRTPWVGVRARGPAIRMSSDVRGGLSGSCRTAPCILLSHAPTAHPAQTGLILLLLLLGRSR
jgi:hypothetical protein